MRPFTLEHLMSWLKGELVQVEPPEVSEAHPSASTSASSVLLKGLSTDTRTLSPGEVFVALVGQRFDGHDFCAEAVSKGASLLVVSADRLSRLRGDERLSSFPKLVVRDTLRALGMIARGYRQTFLPDLKVIALTGSIGKTSTKHWLSVIGGLLGEPLLASQRSYNNEVGVPLTILQATEGLRYLVLEFGARKPGDISYLCEVALPDVGLVRSVAPVHLETFGNMRRIAEEKLGLLRHVISRGGTATAPRQLRRWAGEVLSASELERVAWQSSHLVSVSYPSPHVTEIKLRLRWPELTHQAFIRLDRPVPKAQVENLLVALNTWKVMGYDVEPSLLQRALREGELPERTSVRWIGDLMLIDDSYNSSPWALKEALSFALALGVRPAGAVIGDMLELGRQSRRYHRWIAKFLRALDAVWLYGEEVKVTADELKERATWFPADRYEALRDSVLRAIRTGQVRLLLIKGSRAMRLDRLVEDLSGR